MQVLSRAGRELLSLCSLFLCSLFLCSFAASSQPPPTPATPPALAQSFGEILNPDGSIDPQRAAGASFANLTDWQMALADDGTPHFLQASSNAHWDDRFGYPGTSFYVTTLAAGGGNVYVGLGPLSGEAGYTDVGYIARWDGRRWHAMGAGLDDTPSAIAVSGSSVYVVGSFENAGGKGIAGVARWDTLRRTWNAVGNGKGPRDDSNSPSATAVTVIGNSVYIGGEFVEVDDIRAYNLARWDGTRWSAVGDGLEYDPTGNLGEVYSLAGMADGRLVVGGKFTHAYDSPGSQRREVNYITIWNPQTKTFAALGAGLSLDDPIDDPQVYALAVAGSSVYVGGHFDQAGSIPATNIARWNGSAWSALGSGTNAAVTALVYTNGRLYAGGYFGTAGGVTAHRIARWNGSTWAGLDKRNSDEDSITGVAIGSDGLLYAAGDMELFNNLGVNNIASWNEAEGFWRPLGYGLARNSLIGSVSGVVVEPGGKIIVGGDFNYAGGITVRNLARWDPARRLWENLAGGTDDTIYTLALRGNLLYVGGRFAEAGSISAPHVATLDIQTNQWSALSSGVNGAVNVFAFTPDGLVLVGGSFTAAGAVAADRLALWNPATRNWSAAPFKFNPPQTFHTPKVLAFAQDANGVFIGGDFYDVIINNQASDVNSLLYWERTTGRVLRFGNGVTQLINGNDLKGSVGALLAGPDGALYVGGEFDKVGPGVAANNIARLTGAGWQALGSGVSVPNPETASVHTMRAVGSKLFIGGVFSVAGNARSRNIATFETANGTWEGLGVGLEGGVIDSEVNAIAVGRTAVYIGGEFITAGGAPSSAFAAWNFFPAGIKLDKRVFLPKIQR